MNTSTRIFLFAILLIGCCRLGGQPLPRYYYRLEINSRQMGEPGEFSTAPKTGAPARFTVAFGGGAACIPWYHHQWSTIHTRRPDALFLLGDNVYIDYPEQPQLQQPESIFGYQRELFLRAARI